ncbi:MAG: cobalamin-dependent protein [Ignavibacteriae bacterium]|nr:cobalamin-dependent protein [Ignavibacteriota bacterium]
MKKKRILCVPLDPVHDVGIKIIRNALAQRGFDTELLSPDLPLEDVVRIAAQGSYDEILVSRTLGYGVAELLGRFVDLLDAAGVRSRARVTLGGKAITAELAAELGFDRGFDEHSRIEDVVAYLEGKPAESGATAAAKPKPDITAGYSYKVHDARIAAALDEIVDKLLRWTEGKSSPGIERARLRASMFEERNAAQHAALLDRYLSVSDPVIADAFRKGILPKGVRVVSETERTRLKELLADRHQHRPVSLRHAGERPLFFKFLGSGCPVMDIMHAKVCERWGVDGFLLINPSWEARYEGLLEGTLTHQNDGTVTSGENIRLVRELLEPSTLLTVRAHRGLNTPETVLLAGLAGADMTKIDLVYGSLGAGTDPARLAVDGVEAIRLAAKFRMPYDIPGNDELSGVPAWKTLAGLLINVHLGTRLGARAILKPLFCYGPHIVINGLMEQTFVDYNAAKIHALRSIVDCPIWPGEPIAFMTQTEDRVQSATASSFHAALGTSLHVDAMTIASTDEAYSRGPICMASRIDSLQALHEAARFMGKAAVTPTSAADAMTADMHAKIAEVLDRVRQAPDLPAAISSGLLGDREDGAYPGTFGRGTVA